MNSVPQCQCHNMFVNWSNSKFLGYKYLCKLWYYTFLTNLYLLNQLSTRQLVKITVMDSDCYADNFHCNC